MAEIMPKRQKGGALRGLAFVIGLGFAGMAFTGSASLAQGADPSLQPRQAPLGILVLDQEQLYSQSLYGIRLNQELEAAGQALAAENREIEALLTAEELRLTNERATMEADAFRALADEFDARVEDIRSAQETKARSLTQQADQGRQRFFDLAFPILIELLEDQNAGAILDNRAVILSPDSADITPQAIARINETLGAGGDAPLLDLGVLAQPVPRAVDPNDP